ncbi:MAG: hypothetical protein D3926_05065 [Desulfobacteraceae bacterium]|nr:MAG: hypothetical protein D3926_05065 [Desulfobacteraceae bacterium]
MRKTVCFWFALVIAAAFSQPGAIHSAVWYVSETATGNNSGTSWPNACTGLQAGINSAAHGDQVWVSAGTYRPSSGSGRQTWFALKDGVSVYGGFDGTETLISQRDWKTNQTILSGDIGVPDDPADNSFHVVVALNIDDTTTFSGFIIRDGNADDGTLSEYNQYGGGMYIGASSLTVSHCIFEGNAASEGGGMYHHISNAAITHCLFRNNSGSMLGGGMLCHSSTLTMSYCTFSNNEASGSGAGLYLNTCTDNFISYSTFNNNRANSGAGLLNFNSSTMGVNNTFSANLATAVGGGAMNVGNSTLRFANCTFRKNESKYGGDSVYNSAELNPENCIFAGGTQEYDLVNDGGTVNTYRNIIESQDGFPLNSYDVTGPQPNLKMGPLADNGGETMTHALLRGSIAIDSGSVAVVGLPMDDQRGVLRDSKPDFGAFEYVHPKTMPWLFLLE